MTAKFDLSKAAVFFDFDGTISTTDIGVHVLERLATDDWRPVGDAYGAGEIGSRACMEEEWRCIPASVDEATRRAVAAEVPLDPGFGPLLANLRAAGAQTAVVSDGFGYYVRDRLAAYDVPVFTNDVDFATNALLFPHPTCTACGACGTCKPRVISDAARRGRTTVFIGDGISDRHAARAADVVFAKAGLARWCAAEGIAHTSFGVLAEVKAFLFS